MKNYIGFVNDHSGSMRSLTKAAIADYNANITETKEAASREMLDTVVSVVGIAVPSSYETQRQVVISNPHVLRPINDWPTPGGATPLRDGVGNMIELFKSLPDYNNPNVSFLVLVTTDGGENASRKWSEEALRREIESLQRTDRWTFVFRVPKGYKQTVSNLGVPSGNIQEWETSEKGMRESTAQTTAAMSNYYTARSAGAKGSSSFYSSTANVDTNKLTALDKKEYSLYIVDPRDNGIEIKKFILKHRMKYLKGAAFYQLSKTEARIGHEKLILIRNEKTGVVYTGNEARKMIGLPIGQNARVHPGQHGDWNIFIQSESTNRKLVGGMGVIYWEAQGVEFTEDDEPYLKPQVVNGVVQLPKVNNTTGKPVKSPIPVTHKAKTPEPLYFQSREQARSVARAQGGRVVDAGQHYASVGKRWLVSV